MILFHMVASNDIEKIGEQLPKPIKTFYNYISN